MINLVKKGGKTVQEKTQSQTLTVTCSSGGNSEHDIVFNNLLWAHGLSSLETPTTSGAVKLISLNFEFWNTLNVNAGRSQSGSSGSSTWTIEAYQGDIDANKVESIEVNLNASSVTATFVHPVKCIKSITGLGKSGRLIAGVSINGNTITFTTAQSTAQTCTVEIYY